MKVVKTGFALGISVAVIYLLCVIWGVIFPSWPIKHATVEQLFPYVIWTDITHLITITLRLFVAGWVMGVVYAWVYNLLGKNK